MTKDRLVIISRSKLHHMMICMDFRNRKIIQVYHCSTIWRSVPMIPRCLWNETGLFHLRKLYCHLRGFRLYHEVIKCLSPGKVVLKEYPDLHRWVHLAVKWTQKHHVVIHSSASSEIDLPQECKISPDWLQKLRSLSCKHPG